MKPMETYYVGLDIHKRIVAHCIKTLDGKPIDQGKVEATPAALTQWASGIGAPWIGAMEATMFTGWMYDLLLPLSQGIKVAHPQRLKAISTGKKKSDRIDAAILCDLLRVDLLPECFMAPVETRELRRLLRERNLLVRLATTLKNKNAGLLMECGVQYDGQRLHGKKYFRDLLANLDTPAKHLASILQFNHEMMRTFDATQKQLLKGLEKHHALRERVALLRSIPSVGPVMALVWALEIVDPKRFSSIRKAVSYCGLSSRYIQSADKVTRAPLSKQRNQHLQWALIEVSKMAPYHSEALAAVRKRAIEKGANRNMATLCVARKLVAWLMAVDKSRKPFVLRDTATA